MKFYKKIKFKSFSRKVLYNIKERQGLLIGERLMKKKNLEVNPEKEIIAKNVVENSDAPALVLNDIVKVYGQGEMAVKALKGVNLSFRRNEFVSILGPSGCGKTTLLNIIGGLDRYTSGDLIIEGRSTKNYKDKDWNAYRNNCIGFVFQNYNLIPHQTVLGNVELSLQLSGISKKERRARAVEILERVGLADQIHKKPNQLSGGQMQRVAIARALINNPEIILADEPTGALDTETSIQVLDLLKDIAKSKLVIMVTHNPDLAQRYSTRIINLLDGEVVGDTAPYSAQVTQNPKVMKKPKMGFKTAFGLSLKNLFSKKARTILTSIAGSIGIISVALVLAISNGFSIYMDKMQSETLSSYPLTIQESSVDIESFMDVYENDALQKYPALDNIGVRKAFEKLTGMLTSNKLPSISDENGFTYYLEQADKDLYYDIVYGYGIDIKDYIFTNINMMGMEMFMAVDTLTDTIEDMYESLVQGAIGTGSSFVEQFIPTVQQMPTSSELILSQYDVLYGELPEFTEQNKHKLVLVVDKYNCISDVTLALLGYLGIQVGEPNSQNIPTIDFVYNVDGGESVTNPTELPLEQFLGKELYLANNDLMFDKNGDKFWSGNVSPTTDGLLKLEIAGIIRPKENVSGLLKEGIAYPEALIDYLMAENYDSDIASVARQNETVDIYAKMPVDSNGDGTVDKFEDKITATVSARELCAVNTPKIISIYAKDFESKEAMKAYIDKWNDLHADDESMQISYSDMMSMMFSLLTTMVDGVTYALVAFTSISLIVSSVMIGIITYTSVVERTKEIGVLRALGASKREVSRVFNAETILIGLFAGLLGVGVAYLLCLGINLIIGSALPAIGSIAVLNPLTALVLVAVSVALTLVAGLLPSRAAAKKDPVVALRTE